MSATQEGAIRSVRVSVQCLSVGTSDTHTIAEGFQRCVHPMPHRWTRPTHA